MNKQNIFTLILSLLIAFAYSQENTLTGLNSITKEDLLKTVTYLSSKELNGRMAGSKGYNKAADYAADIFKRLGLKPAGEKGYFQNFNIETNEIKSPCKLSIYKANVKVKDLKLGVDYVCRGFTGSGKIKTEVVFCGYGISKPELGYDDYKEINVKDKIVLIFKQNPDWQIANNKWDEAYARNKAAVAFKHGAVGVLFVSRPNDKEVQGIIGSVMDGNNPQNTKMPQLHISVKAANEFLTGMKNDLSKLQTEIDNNKSPFSIALQTIAEINVNARYTPKANTMNIIGMIEGSDPVLKNEYLILGAHIDHVGGQAGEIYFPGANDNASGSALILQLAKAFSINEIKPKRSVIFILFTAEENGMLGSKYYAEHPVVPIEKTVAMFNFDCIAHGDSILVRCGDIYPELWKIAKTQNENNIKMMVKQTTNTSVADAEAFHLKAIPTLYFVTTNTYEFLHMTTDTVNTLNGNLYEKITKLAFLTAFDVASGNYKKEKMKNSDNVKK